MMSAQFSLVADKDRRRYKRYIVEGSVTFQNSEGESSALLNVARGGVLVRTDTLCREGTVISLRFKVASYPETFASRGQVVGTKQKLMAIKFLERPKGLETLLGWLDRENCPWAGVA